jgi:hypothetical protein
MVRKRDLATVAVALLITACDETMAPDGAAMLPGGLAHVMTTNQPHTPFDFIVTTCEEDVFGSGHLHILTTQTVSAAEDTITVFHINARGTGTGVTSGARYRFNDTFRIQTNQLSEWQLVSSFMDALKLIGEGDAGDLHVRALFRVTIDAKGVLRAFVDRMQVTCS